MLCRSIEGIEFWLRRRRGRGRSVRCVVTTTVLVVHYGAMAGDEASWFEAFDLNRSDIEDRANAACARRDDAHVVVLTDLSGHLRAAAGRRC